MNTCAKFAYVLLMVSTVVLVDLFFFRHHTAARLIANIAIVGAYAAIYFIFLKHS